MEPGAFPLVRDIPFSVLRFVLFLEIQT